LGTVTAMPDLLARNDLLALAVALSAMASISSTAITALALRAMIDKACRS
jgi:hypothetical protein